MIEKLPYWVVQIAAVWFLCDKLTLLAKRFEEWDKRREYEKARKKNEKDYYAGYEDVRSVPPGEFPTFEEWLKEREREETERERAKKEKSDLDLLKTFNRKKWEQIMAEKSAKESQEYRAHRAYLESIRPPNVSKIDWLRQHGIYWDPPVGWVAESCGITPAPAVPENPGGVTVPFSQVISIRPAQTPVVPEDPAGVKDTSKEAGESDEGLEYRRL